MEILKSAFDATERRCMPCYKRSKPRKRMRRKQSKVHEEAEKAAKRILHIDDEEDFCRPIKNNLEATGSYIVEYECDPRNVLEVARQFAPDLIILNISMPHMSGPEVGQLLRDDPELKRIPFFFCSALTGPPGPGEDPVVWTGGDALVGKPVKMEHLIQAIEQIYALGPGPHEHMYQAEGSGSGCSPREAWP